MAEHLKRVKGKGPKTGVWGLGDAFNDWPYKIPLLDEITNPKGGFGSHKLMSSFGPREAKNRTGDFKSGGGFLPDIHGGWEMGEFGTLNYLFPKGEGTEGRPFDRKRWGEMGLMGAGKKWSTPFDRSLDDVDNLLIKRARSLISKQDVYTLEDVKTFLTNPETLTNEKTGAPLTAEDLQRALDDKSRKFVPEMNTLQNPGKAKGFIPNFEAPDPQGISDARQREGSGAILEYSPLLKGVSPGGMGMYNLDQKKEFGNLTETIKGAHLGRGQDPSTLGLTGSGLETYRKARGFVPNFFEEYSWKELVAVDPDFQKIFEGVRTEFLDSSNLSSSQRKKISPYMTPPQLMFFDLAAGELYGDAGGEVDVGLGNIHVPGGAQPSNTPGNRSAMSEYLKMRKEHGPAEWSGQRAFSTSFDAEAGHSYLTYDVSKR